jgi:thiol-disulfide isomerase/thioredoxin
MNWPKLIVEYGQTAAWIAIALSLFAVVMAARKGRYFLPRGPLGWIASLVALVIIYFSVGFLRWAETKVNPLKPVFREADRQAPEFAFQMVADGSPHSLSEYRGKVVLLNIWATWCPSCREEMPDLDRLQQQYGNDGLVVIAVSDETKEQIEKFPAFSQLHFVKGRVNADLPAAGLYIRPDVARPATHIIDRQGVLRETLIGGDDYSSFEKHVLPYLNSRS